MSQSTHIDAPWSPWHNRLHKSLKSKEDLLPYDSPLLLSISGGQDSMALVKLILDLKRFYRWDIYIWHGDHGWHNKSKTIAKELEAWCKQQGLNFISERAPSNQGKSEEAARNWRYESLMKRAESLHLSCKHVLTGHTATDQAETLVLNLARGSYLGGLSSLRENRTWKGDIQLIRPLIIFSRQETAQICKELNIPIWIDPSNESLIFKRNRVRNEIIPILEEMHPGSSQRIAKLSEKFGEIKQSQDYLIRMVLQQIESEEGIAREKFSSLPKDTRINIIAKWLNISGVPVISSSQLEEISNRSGPKMPPGSRDLPKGWKIKWNKSFIQLTNQET